MRSSHSRLVLTAAALVPASVLAASVLAACGGGSRPAPAAAPSPSAAPAPSAAAVAADSARDPYTEADVRFMSAMVGHHAQALVMAGWAPTHGASPAVRTLAERIVNGQQDEILTMQRWLRKRGRPVPEATPAHMRMAGAEHGHLMPGMLTEAEMRRLDAARGADFDRLFLTYMIRHHQGAVSMVRELFGTYGAAQEEAAFKLANDVGADQTAEIARMERMLAALSPAAGGR